LPSSSGNRFISSSAHPRRIPVERRREVVGQHLVGKLRVDRVSANRAASSRSAVFVSIHSRSANGAAASDFVMA
jgi:hypothetical protein